MVAVALTMSKHDDSTCRHSDKDSDGGDDDESSIVRGGGGDIRPSG